MRLKGNSMKPQGGPRYYPISTLLVRPRVEALLQMTSSRISPGDGNIAIITSSLANRILFLSINTNLKSKVTKCLLSDFSLPQHALSLQRLSTQASIAAFLTATALFSGDLETSQLWRPLLILWKFVSKLPSPLLTNSAIVRFSSLVHNYFINNV